MRLCLTIIFCLCIVIVFAQKDTVRLREISRNAKVVVTDRPPQAVYFLIGGSGPLLSVNYDRRFQKRVNGAGFAVGLGFFGESEEGRESVGTGAAGELEGCTGREAVAAVGLDSGAVGPGRIEQ